MSDVDEFETENENNESGNAPKALRQQNSKLSKELQEARDLIANLQKETRSRTIADVLRDKQANPKLAKYIARDIEGDITTETVEKWLADEGELFGYKPVDADGDEGEQFEDETVQAARQISNASRNAPPAPSGLTPERIKSMSAQELIQAGLLDPKF